MLIESIFCNEFAFFFHLLPGGLPQEVRTAIYNSGDLAYLFGKEIRGVNVVKFARVGMNIASVVLWSLPSLLLPTWVAIIPISVSALLWFLMWGLASKHFTGKVGASELDSIGDAWKLAHFGALNFALDIPGRGCANAVYSHAVIILANIVSALAITIGIFTAPQLARAWGCYRDAPISELTFGLCATYFDVCPDEKYRCPDFSRPVCMLSTTQHGCGYATMDGDLEKGFDPYVHVGFFAAAISLTIYVLSFSRKMDDLEKTAGNRARKIKDGL